MKPVGLVKKENYIFGLSLPCCECGIIKPAVLCDGTGHCLCVKQFASFPFSETVPKPVCACCFLKCLPAPAGCLKPYEAAAADKPLTPTNPATMLR